MYTSSLEFLRIFTEFEFESYNELLLTTQQLGGSVDHEDGVDDDALVTAQLLGRDRSY